MLRLLCLLRSETHPLLVYVHVVCNIVCLLQALNVAILIDDLRNDDVQVRLNSVRMLKVGGTPAPAVHSKGT